MGEVQDQRKGIEKSTTTINDGIFAAKLDVGRKIRINDRNQTYGEPINFNAALFNSKLTLAS